MKIPQDRLIRDIKSPLGTPRLGTGRVQPKRERITDGERKMRENPYPLSLDALKKVAERVKTDPVFAAEIAFQLRQPRNESKVRRNIVARKVQKEPMLNAHPDSIDRGLKYSEPSIRDRVPKGELYERLVIKPTSIRSAKAGRNSPFWGERLWNVYTLKYAKGFVIVTDRDEESKTFQSMGELRSAIIKSGWEIVR